MSGAGHVRRNGKAWQYVFDGPPHTGGGRRQISKSGFATKKEAQKAMAVRQATIHEELLTVDTAPTLGEWLQGEWLPNHEREIKHSTAVSYMDIVRSHIAPDFLATVRLPELTASDVNAFLRRIEKKPARNRDSFLSRKTQRNIYAVLAKALQDGIELSLVPPACLVGVKKPSPEVPDKDYWNPEEINEFLEYSESASRRMYPLYLLAIVTGMRRGELAGLQWKHASAETGSIQVEKTRLRVRDRVYMADPKSAKSRRRYQVAEAGKKALRIARGMQEMDKGIYGADWEDSGLVFTNPDGTGIDPDQITSRFRRDCQVAGARYISFKGLRTSVVSNLLNAGYNPKAVSMFVGHGDVQTTLTYYAQFIPSQLTGAEFEATLLEIEPQRD